MPQPVQRKTNLIGLNQEIVTHYMCKKLDCPIYIIIWC